MCVTISIYVYVFIGGQYSNCMHYVHDISEYMCIHIVYIACIRFLKYMLPSHPWFSLFHMVL